MLFLFALGIAVVAFSIRAGFAKQAKARSAHVPPGLITVSTLIGVIAVLVAFVQWVRVIPAGHVGVVDLFGQVGARPLPSGLNLVNPFARVIKMSIQTQELKETMDVPSKEGLTVRLDASVLYHLDPAKAPEVYRTIGYNYVPVILEPQFRSVTRGVTASFEAKALYTFEREELARMLAVDLEKVLAPRGIEIEATPLRQITLPAKLAAAIEEKLGMEQESQRMEFVLQKEQQEAERKRIEAGGISDFQRIISQGLNDPLLRWKGIEATIDLAKSANTKIVVVGAGKDGLPLILGGN